MDTKVLEVIKKIAYGIILGVLYYLVYGYILPVVILSFTKVGLETLTVKLLPYLGLFIALSITEELLKNHPISVPFRMLSKVMYALILMIILNGGVVATTLSHEPYSIYVRTDLTILLHMVIALSLIYGIVDALSIVRT